LTATWYQNKLQVIEIFNKIKKLTKAAGFWHSLESLGYQLLGSLVNYPG
jgi:hypothetical protein